MSGLSFYAEHSHIYVNFEKTEKRYRELEIEKKEDHLKFTLINEFNNWGYGINSGFYGFSGFGFDCGCSTVEVLEEDDKKEIGFELLEDLKNEGEIYQFILKNIDIITETKNLPGNRDYENIITKINGPKIKSVFKNIEIGKTFEINIEHGFVSSFSCTPETKVYIKKIKDNFYRIYLEENGNIDIDYYNYNYLSGEYKKGFYYDLDSITKRLLIVNSI